MQHPKIQDLREKEGNHLRSVEIGQLGASDEILLAMWPIKMAAQSETFVSHF